MTFGDFYDCVKGYNRRIETETKIQDSLNYSLGQYMIYSVNNPKKYPERPFLEEAEIRKQNIATTDEQRIRMARIKYGKKK